VRTLAPNPSWLAGSCYDYIWRQHRLDGTRVPSVTQAIDLAHPGRFDHVRPDVLAHKTAIGSVVHAAAHYHAEGDLLDSSVADAARVRVEAWKWFTASRRVEPILCETVICSRDLSRPTWRRRPYIGKLDFLCSIDRRLLVLLDLKTGVPSLARLQLAAYLDALYQQYPDLIAADVQRWAIELCGDGRYKVHVFRDDRTDASDFRRVLEQAYDAPGVEWRTSTMSAAALFDLPDEAPASALAFDLPTEPAPASGTTSGLFEVPFEMPKETPRSGQALVGDLLPPEDEPLATALSVPEVSPTFERYLDALQPRVQALHARAQQLVTFAESAAVETPAQLQALGEFALQCKPVETEVMALFDPAIKTLREWLEPLYGIRKPILDSLETAGRTAVRRYNARKRELEEIDRKAKAEADRRQREAQDAADRKADQERRRLADEAVKAAQQGNAAGAANLVTQMHAVEPEKVQEQAPPPSLAQSASVKGVGERENWCGEITDIKLALHACASPDIFREIAGLIEAGALTPAGGQSVTTVAIAERLRALATEMPFVPSNVFAANDAELKKRAAADRDTLTWPGFRFFNDPIPVRRTRGRG